LSDYDIENPITKTEGIVRMMTKRLESASEEDKAAIQSQMTAVKNASVTDAFQQYSQQKVFTN
jgi:hypothetical protein